MRTSHHLIAAAALLGIATLLTHLAPRTESDPSTAGEIPRAGIGTPPDDRPHASSANGVSPSAASPDRADSAATKPPTASLNNLPSSEQQSLWKAFSEARREVRPIPAPRAARAENLGYDFYAMHPKQNLTTRFGSEGVQIVSSDRTYTDDDTNHPSTAWQAEMRLLSFAGESIQLGAPATKSERASSLLEYHHRPGLAEWFDNGVEGIEHGYTIAARPAHLRDGEEVTLEVELSGLQSATQRRDDGTQALDFLDGERRVLSYSKLLVVDAHGKELPATMTPTDAGFTLAYHDSQATYPVIVDPLIINEEAKLNRIDSGDDAYFGTSVAISGDSVVIGAYGDADSGSFSGSAYIFSRSGNLWVQRAKLNANDAASGDQFGSSVAISGDSVVVSAYGDADGGNLSGSAYVFKRAGSSPFSQWFQQAKLTASDAAELDLFGFSVAISGDTVVVGAYGDADGGSFSGSAYAFTRSGSTWSQQDKLTADDAAANDNFGISVAVSGDSVIVGATGDDDDGLSSGSTYVFIRSGDSWDQQDKLTALDGAAGDGFGGAVAISGDSVVVGANGDDDDGSFSGSAYVFTRSGSIWSQQDKLTADDAISDDRFGESVSIDADYLVVGAARDDDDGPNSGSAYVFNRIGSTWFQQTKLTASDAATEDRFGGAVAISADYVIVGASQDDDVGSDSGSAYLFTRSESTWSQQTKVAVRDAGGDEFGTAVAVSGDSLVVGAVYDSDGGFSSGSAYIFTRSGGTWSEQAKLIADDGQFDDRFGISVAISGDTVAVGADADDDGGSASGSTYVYNRIGSTWFLQAKLTADDAASDYFFGRSVAISGDSVVVGAYGNDDTGVASGSAYIFTRSSSSWSQQAKLTADDAATGDLFGFSVAISGDSVVVGAYRDDDGASNSGSAYIFTRSSSSWSQEAKLTADDAATGASFGYSVAISGDSVVVGDYRSAYIFTRSGAFWTQQDKLTSEDPAADDHFGRSVAISGDSVVVGAARDDDSGASSGSAYLFTRSSNIWSQQAKLRADDAAAGDRFGGSVAVSGDSVVIGAARDDDSGGSSGSVYIYRFSVPAARRLLVYDHLGLQLLNGAAASEFPGQRLSTGTSHTFRLANSGTLDLDIQSVSLGGADAGQFSLDLPDISSTADLSASESLDCTITFSPAGSSDPRNATVIITSNDTDTPVFSFTISGLGLSNTDDGDSDGMNDWAEYSLRGFGFDWTESQPNEVSDFYDLAPTAGLYTQDQAAAVNGSAALVDVDTTTNTASIRIGLKDSDDLETFTPITIDPAKLSVDGDGNILYELDATAGKKFFRAGFEP